MMYIAKETEIGPKRSISTHTLGTYPVENAKQRRQRKIFLAPVDHLMLCPSADSFRKFNHRGGGKDVGEDVGVLVTVVL